MDTGFNYYHGADPGEYDLVVSNSEGGLDGLLELGARRAEAVFWGADPEFFAPQPVEKECDVFFYGYSDKFRARVDGGDGRRAVARRCPTSTSRSAATTSRATSGRARQLGDVPFNVFARAISAARVNLCITRRSHASVYASSSCRPFELAVVRRRDRREPDRGDRALVRAGLRAARRPRRGRGGRRRTATLLDDPAQAEEMGRRARERVLDEHTYRHRARRLLELVGAGGGGACRLSSLDARAEPDARLAALRRIAIVPALQRGAERRPRDRRAARVRPRARDRRRLRRLDRPHGRGRRRARRARDPAAVQPRHRRRRADRLPLRVGGAATSSPCASTATASTTRRSSGACSRRCSRARPTSSSARASSATRSYRSSAPRRVGIRVLAWVVSRDRAPEGDRPDLRLPGARTAARSGSSPPTTRTTTRRWRGW